MRKALMLGLILFFLSCNDSELAQENLQLREDNLKLEKTLEATKSALLYQKEKLNEYIRLAPTGDDNLVGMYRNLKMSDSWVGISFVKEDVGYIVSTILIDDQLKKIYTIHPQSDFIPFSSDPNIVFSWYVDSKMPVTGETGLLIFEYLIEGDTIKGENYFVGHRGIANPNNYRIELSKFDTSEYTIIDWFERGVYPSIGE